MDRQGTLAEPKLVFGKGTLNVDGQGTKIRLVQQIEDLKNDIQYIIDKKKELQPDDTNIDYLDEQKSNKIQMLKNLTDSLKMFHKKEKEHAQTKHELKAIGRAIDNLEFSKAKKKNTQDAINRVKVAKEERDLAKNKYLEYMDNERIYLQNDPDELPCYIFLHNTILEKYGLCPYLEHDTENCTENLKETIYKNRLEWLLSLSDKGKKYFDMYNNIIKKEELHLLSNAKVEIENNIYDFIKNILSDTQLDIFNNSIKFLDEYTHCTIKTKKLKERYKLFMHNLSILYSESKLPVHMYLSLKYNMHEWKFGLYCWGYFNCVCKYGCTSRNGFGT